jgi:hypothetical protein
MRFSSGAKFSAKYYLIVCTIARAFWLNIGNFAPAPTTSTELPLREISLAFSLF